MSCPVYELDKLISSHHALIYNYAVCVSVTTKSLEQQRDTLIDGQTYIYEQMLCFKHNSLWKTSIAMD